MKGRRPMKAIALHGSPRRNGNSDTLVSNFLEGLRASGHSEIQEFYANELSIKPCQGCLTCNKPPYKCAIEDDMREIYSAFIDADVVIFATPMYWGYMTAQLKTVLDRMEAIASQRLFRDKTFVAILTYHHHYESVVAFFERIREYFRFRLHTITYCSLGKDGQNDVHVSNCREKLEEAYVLGKSLGEAAI